MVERFASGSGSGGDGGAEGCFGELGGEEEGGGVDDGKGAQAEFLYEVLGAWLKREVGRTRREVSEL